MARVNDPDSADRPVLGMALMLGFCLVAPLGDGLAKWIGDAVPLLQLVAARFAVQAAILLPLALVTRRSLRMARRNAALVALRTVLHIAGIGMMFLSLRYLELADAIAIAFVMPFIMLLLGWSVLGEQVGPWRLGGCAVGFVGTLLVVQPSFAEVGAPALLPVGVALTFACFMLVTRLIAKGLDPVAMQGVSGAMALVVLAPVLLLAQGSGLAELDPRPMAGGVWAAVIAMGVLGTGAHLLMTWSLRFAPSATLAPMQYLEIPFAVVVGWAMFEDFPNGVAAIGICIVLAAGLFNVWREHAVGRAARRPAPPQAPPAA
jgi:drug/metabolite transporter (DMT)-like permease